MGILNLRFKELEGKVGEPKAGEVKVTSTLPKVKNIYEKDLEITRGRTSVVIIDFEYNVVYEPTNANIRLEGELLYTDKHQKNILKTWRKEKKLDESVALNLLNYIFKKCTIQSIKIAEDLQLPLPVKLPAFVKK